MELALSILAFFCGSLACTVCYFAGRRHARIEHHDVMQELVGIELSTARCELSRIKDEFPMLYERMRLPRLHRILCAIESKTTGVTNHVQPTKND